MNGRCKVFVVNHSPDVLDLLKAVVKEDPGCEVEGALVASPDNFERIREFRPDLVLLDFIPAHDESWRLLDQLRADEATSSLPVLALSTMEPVVEQTLASYNVREVLTKPFDVQRMGEVIRAILSEPRMEMPPVAERPGAEVLREAADILAENTRAIVGQWLEKLNEIDPFKSHSALRPRQRIDEVPILLWGTVVALRTGQFDRLFEQQGFFRRAAVNHARERRRQGIALGPLVREYKLLRDALWQTLQEGSTRGEWTAEDVFRVGQAVHRVLDEIVAITIESYAEAEGQGGT